MKCPASSIQSRRRLPSYFIQVGCLAVGLLLGPFVRICKETPRPRSNFGRRGQRRKLDYTTLLFPLSRTYVRTAFAIVASMASRYTRRYLVTILLSAYLDFPSPSPPQSSPHFRIPSFLSFRSRSQDQGRSEGQDGGENSFSFRFCSFCGGFLRCPSSCVILRVGNREKVEKADEAKKRRRELICLAMRKRLLFLFCGKKKEEGKGISRPTRE